MQSQWDATLWMYELCAVHSFYLVWNLLLKFLSLIYNYSNALFWLIKKITQILVAYFISLLFLFLCFFYSYLMKFLYFVILIINFKMIVKDTNRMVLKENAIPNSLLLYIYMYLFFLILYNDNYFHVIIEMHSFKLYLFG